MSLTTNQTAESAAQSDTNMLHLALMLAVSIPLWLASVLGNLLVLVCVYRDKKLHRPSYYLVAALSIADISYPLVGFIPGIYVVFGRNICNPIARFALYLPGYAIGTSSVLHIIALTVERYCSIAFPVFHRNSLTSSRVGWTSCAIWVSSLILGIGRFPFANDSSSPCEARPSNGSLITWSVVGITSICLLTALNVHLLVLVTKLSNAAKKDVHNGRNDQEARVNAGNVKATRGVTIIVFFFVFCFLPIMVFWIIAQAYPNSNDQLKYELSIAPIVTVTINGAVNPVVYASQNPHFRSAFKKLFRKLANRVSDDEETGNS